MCVLCIMHSAFTTHARWYLSPPPIFVHSIRNKLKQTITHQTHQIYIYIHNMKDSAPWAPCAIPHLFQSLTCTKAADSRRLFPHVSTVAISILGELCSPHWGCSF